ncbi:MAG: caspase family protein, partial [Planctomycetaceae bacterium]|nr:caspase family protein [Planctomycetaceae bacterium]
MVRPPIGPGDRGRLFAAALSPDGRTLAVGGCGLKDAYGSIYLISTATRRLERVLKGHTNVIRDLAFGVPPGGRLLLASGSYDNTARIWDVAVGECRRVLEGHTGAVCCVVFAPDASRLATASLDKTARIWSVADGKCLQNLQGHAKEVQCVAWSHDGTHLATGGSDRSIKFWSPDGALSRNIENLGDEINSVLFTADSSELLYTWGANAGSGAAVLQVSSGQERVRFTEQYENSVTSGAISPDGTVAATAGGNSHEIYLWKLKDAAPIKRLVGKGKRIFSVGWSPDGKSIAWGNTTKVISWNDRGPLERSFSLADLGIGPSPDTSYRRARESRGSLSLQPTGPTSLEVKQQDAVVAKIALPYSSEAIYSFSFVMGDRVAVSAGYVLYLFDARTGAMIREFRGHTGVVWAVAPSPNERFLLSASGDQTLRIWDPDRDEPLLSLFVAGDDWIAWTPEGYYAASPGGEKLMGWHVNDGPDRIATFYPAAKLRKSLYRPDVIKLLLTAGSLARALEVADRARGQATERVEVAAVLPPKVEITAPRRSGTHLQGPRLEVKAVARSVGRNPVTALRLLLDGRPYQGQGGVRAVEPPKLGAVALSWAVDLEPGTHTLAVQAEGAKSQGLSEPVEVTYAPEEAVELPSLYVLAIGVSAYPGDLRLHYAAQDAEAVERTFRARSGPLFRRVEVKRLTDAGATRKDVLAGLTWLRRQMTQRDVGVVFFSGHGMRDAEGSL